MSRRLSASLLAAVFALSPVPVIVASTPAAAQANINISFDFFYNELSPYGEWNYHPRWGDVWRPTRVGRDFRPFYRGYWVETEYGSTWESEEPFGDLTSHYGRWVYDPYDGWLWVPGYTWAPAWVAWRGDGRNIGWFPLPPDDQFLAGYDVYRPGLDWNRGYFGYSDWYGPSIVAGLAAAWTFVALDHFADRDYYRYAYPPNQVVNIVNNTQNITNYTVVNNRIVNRSVDVAQVERASGRRIQRVEARQVVRTPITTVDTGRQVLTRERERHGGDARAPARERVRQLSREEVQVPVRERRSVNLQRDQQQAQQPGAQQQPDRDQQRAQRQQQREQAQQPNVQQRSDIDRRDEQRAQRQQQREQAQQPNVQQREQAQQPNVQQREQAQQRERQDAQRAQAEQQQKRQQQERVQRERDDRAAVQQRDAQQKEAVQAQQNRARAEQQQQERARAAAPERRERAQTDQQGRGAGQRAEQQQQQQAAAQEKQQRAAAARQQGKSAEQGKSDEEKAAEEKQRRERQRK
jgi:hypothetical protein